MNVTVGKNALVIPDRAIVDRFPDTDRYKHRFTINSESSNAKYMISFDSASGSGWWTCSCRGNIRNGHCKHLKALNLVTRTDITQRKLR